MRLLMTEGRAYVLILAALAVLFGYLHAYLVAVPIALFFFLLFFFRDPERALPVPRPGMEDFVSPADGKVTAVGVVEENYLFEGPAAMVTIFLSPLDVHVNRSPLAGEIKQVEHRPGLFRAAYIADAPSVNERNYIVIENSRARCLAVQIVGVLARRVVCWVKPGQSVDAGARIGLMKFGSCMQVFMPPQTELQVSEGDRVRAGETVIGGLRHV